MKKYIITILILLATSIAYSQQQSVTTQGTEFFAVFMLNGSHSVGDSGLELSLMVTAKRACSVTVRNPNSTWTNTFNVSANSTYKFDIPSGQHSQCYINTPTNTGINKGLLITSTDTISLYASNFASASFDGTIILPTTALGNEYIIQAYTPTLVGYETQAESRSEFSVTAVEDGTIVDVTPSVLCYTSTNVTTSSPFTITLNRGQSALIKSTCLGASGNLSGTRVVARDCKKIAVFNGDNTTQVPTGNYGDHIYEQAFPTTSWGKKFVITNTLQNASTGRTKDCVRVTASANNTTIRKNNTLLSTINAGQTYEFQLTATEKAAYIETSNPCAVYMYLVSQTQGGSSNGDPSMVWVAPLEQRIDNIVFNTFYPTIYAENRPTTHIVNIVSETSNTSQIRLDGSTVTGWETVSGNTNYSFARKVISHDAHSITTTGGNGFIAHVYGIGNAVSYAYSVGSMATNLAERMYINGIGSTDASVNGRFCEGQQISFSSEVDYDYDNIIWDFGDGTTYTGTATSHTFDNEGEYTISMQVNSNGSGCSSFSNSVDFNVTIGKVWEREITTEANYGETVTIEGVTFVARHDTTITQTYPSINDCDSTVIHNVIIRTIVNDIYAEICEGETYNENGFSEFTTGQYTHTVQLPSGIDSITTLYLVVRDNPVASITGNNALCNGSVTLVANGGDTYIWSNNETTSGITITEPGRYSVTVTNEFGCTATARHEIAREIQINVSYDPILCHGGTTEVTVTAQYGIPPYTGERTETVRAGSRTYRVTDSEGCTAQETIDITEPEAITNERDEAEAYCSVEYGTVTVIPHGGVGSYSILWDDGSNNFTNNNITPGTFHTYTITDANGCTYTDSTKISQEPQITITITHENVSCNNGINGSISVTNVNNGHEPYTYLWNNNQTGETAINLAAGNYQVTVTDDHNCTATATVSVTQPDALSVEGSVKNASCIGLCDGRIAVEANGGTPSYSYRWSTGYDMAELTELCADTYNLTVTDANGCSTNRSYTIIQPAQMSVSATATDVTCYAGSDGKITVTVSGGTTPYSYALNEYMAESSTDNTLTGLSAGHHVVYISDAKNCTARAEATISSPERLLAEYEIVNISCKEASDGEIHVAALGGHPPYFITTDVINNQPIDENPAITGLRSGTYHLIVTDSTGCSYSMKNIRIPENLNECIHVPNVFTPNDDGINDTWEITHIDMYPDAKIFVYNRWGQKMYEGDGTSEYWNGEYRGKKVPAGTYFYVVALGEGHNTYSGPLSILY